VSDDTKPLYTIAAPPVPPPFSSQSFSLIYTLAMFADIVGGDWFSKRIGLRWILTLNGLIWAPLVVRLFVARRAVSIRFFTDRVEIDLRKLATRGRSVRTEKIRLPAIRSFDDGSSEQVVIRTEGRRGWAIQTRNEPDRVAVLEILDRIGVPREGGEGRSLEERERAVAAANLADWKPRLEPVPDPAAELRRRPAAAPKAGERAFGWAIVFAIVVGVASAIALYSWRGRPAWITFDSPAPFAVPFLLALFAGFFVAGRFARRISRDDDPSSRSGGAAPGG
jgi:hypothetical protein